MASISGYALLVLVSLAASMSQADTVEERLTELFDCEQEQTWPVTAIRMILDGLSDRFEDGPNGTRCVFLKEPFDYQGLPVESLCGYYDRPDDWILQPSIGYAGVKAWIHVTERDAEKLKVWDGGGISCLPRHGLLLAQFGINHRLLQMSEMPMISCNPQTN